MCLVEWHHMHEKVEINREYHLPQTTIIYSMGNLLLVIANKINDLPLALGNVVSDFETMDMLTPSRLRLGRNNNRKKDSRN